MIGRRDRCRTDRHVAYSLRSMAEQFIAVRDPTGDGACLRQHDTWGKYRRNDQDRKEEKAMGATHVGSC